MDDEVWKIVQGYTTVLKGLGRPVRTRAPKSDGGREKAAPGVPDPGSPHPHHRPRTTDSEPTEKREL